MVELRCGSAEEHKRRNSTGAHPALSSPCVPYSAGHTGRRAGTLGGAGGDDNGSAVTRIIKTPLTASPVDIPPPAQNNLPKNLEFLKNILIFAANVKHT